MRGEVQELPPEYGYVLMLGASKQHFQGKHGLFSQQSEKYNKQQSEEKFMSIATWRWAFT